MQAHKASIYTENVPSAFIIMHMLHSSNIISQRNKILFYLEIVIFHIEL